MKRLNQAALSMGALCVVTMSAMAAQGALRTYFANDPVGRNVVMIESRAPLETMLTRSSQVTGEIHVNPQNVLDNPQARFELDMASLDTGIALRNEHMKGANWLDTTKYPKAVFTLKSIVPPAFDGPMAQQLLNDAMRLQDGKTTKLAVTGTLEMRGMTRLVVAGIEVTSTAANKDTAARLPGDLLHVRATFPIKLDEFGINVPAGAGLKVANQEQVTVDIFTSSELPKAQ